MKKVCILTSVHSPFDIRIFHKECRSLAQAGYDVTLIVPHEQDEVRDGVKVKAIPKPTGRIIRMILTVWQVYREAVRLDAGIYHFHDSELIPAGLLLRLKGKKVVYDIHEDVPATLLSRHYLPRWARRPLAWLIGHVEDAACGWFSALLPATPAIAERFTALNSHSVVAQNFPFLKEFAPQVETSWNQRCYSIAYVGGIMEKRGIRQMVEAMGLLSDSMPVKLKLAGSFSPLSLRNKISRLPGWKRVDELGFLDRAEVKNLLSQVFAGLVLFLPDPNHVRSQPNKIFEYMSTGIPVIASNFPLWRQIIEGAGCGLLVDPLDPKAIAEAIEYLLAHPQESEAMGRRGREAVEKFYNWESEKQKLLQLYTELVG